MYEVKEVRVNVPASTSNLGPGFDCVGLALDLTNRITVERVEGSGLEIEVHGEGVDRIPCDEANLTYRAMRRLFQEAGKELKGVHLVLENHIPLRKGLGSSGAAILGGLTAAALLSGKEFSERDILDLAFRMEGHPDNVVAALLGGVVVASRSNDHIETIRMDPPDGLRVIVAVPDFELSTMEAREILPRQIRFEDAVYNVGHAALLVAALMAGDRRVLREAMRDRLHQPYREPLIPGMRTVFEAALDAGASGVAVSGAGPSLLALTWERFEEIAAAMKAAWSAFGVDAESLILEPCSSGLTMECPACRQTGLMEEHDALGSAELRDDRSGARTLQDGGADRRG